MRARSTARTVDRVIDRMSSRPGSKRVPAWLSDRGIGVGDAGIASAAVCYILIQVWSLAKRVPLGHDEAVYLLRARYFAGGSPDGDGYWAPYRAPGLSAVLSLPMRIFGESVTISRFVVVLFGAAGIVLVGLLARSLADARVGAVAAWLVVVCAAYTDYGSLLLLDIPGVTLSLAAMLSLEYALRGGTVRWWPGLMVPVWSMAAIYVRFGTTTTLAAGLIAIVVVRSDLLLEGSVRVRNAVRLAAIAVLSAIGVASVLLIPFMTGETTSPFATQRSRQVGKGISPWASYGDLADMLWPNGSRAGEAVSALTLALLVGGLGLGLVAVVRGRYRRVMLAGFVATALWIVGINVALAELFANYVALGIPFIALLCAPGWVYLYEQVALTPSRRLAAGIAVGLVVVAGVVSVTRSSAEQVGAQTRFEGLRATGSLLEAQTPDQQCAIITSYMQIGWYSDCMIRTFAFVALDDYVLDGPLWSAVGPPPVPMDRVADGHLYVVIVDRGKRQPTGATLDTIIANATLVIDQPDLPTATRTYRVDETD